MYYRLNLEIAIVYTMKKVIQNISTVEPGYNDFG